jgi:hypothetical protein
MELDELVERHPTVYHMAEDGTWPSIKSGGLLSTAALVDLYNPPAATRSRVLNGVRRSSVTLKTASLPPAIIRDQLPLKFLGRCLNPGTTPQAFLDALNSRVFFWLTHERLRRLLNARMYRRSPHVVLHVDTQRLLARHAAAAELAPYNTGSMHVPTAPKRGTDVFVPISDYPYDDWRRKRGSSGEAAVELTVSWAVPDVADHVYRVERWNGGKPVEVLHAS